MPKKKSVEQTTFVKRTISLPAELVNEIEIAVDARGISFSEYTAIALRGMPKSTVTIQLNHKMPMGKYRNVLVEQVARADPGYLLWMAETGGRHQVGADVLALCRSVIDAVTEIESI